jgi:heterodisulfide reductase subunit A-like polyferredoxin
MQKSMRKSVAILFVLVLTSLIGFNACQKDGGAYSVNQSACTACKNCSGSCRYGAISFGSNGKATINASKCVGCGACARVCPTGAISN